MRYCLQYPWWLPPQVAENATRADYAALFRRRVKGLSERIYVTEFGGSLNAPNENYEQPAVPGSFKSSPVNAYQGMDDAVTALRQQGVGVKGAFFCKTYEYTWCTGS